MSQFLKRWTWWWPWLLMLLVLIQPTIDPDLGWHLSTGKWMWQYQTWPVVDSFSFSASGHPYIAHSWLLDLGLLAGFQTLGWWGVNLILAVPMLVAILILVKSTALTYPKQRLLLIGLPVLVWFLLSFVGLRTHGVTFLGLSLIYDLYQHLSTNHFNRRWLWGLPILFLIWAQLHVGVVIGWVWLVILLSVSVWQQQWNRDQILKSVLLILACLIAIIINPYGLKLLTFTLNLGQSYWSSTYNQDWLPLLSSRLPSSTLPLRLLLVLTTSYLIAFTKSKQRWLLLLTLVLSLYSIRFILLLLVLLIPELLHQSNLVLSRLKLLPVILNLAALIISGLVVAKTLPSAWCAHTSPECHARLGNFPLESVTWLQSNGDRYHLLNYYDWGGYLTWNLPESLIFIDGRMDNFIVEGEPLMATHATLLMAETGWLGRLDNLNPDAVLIPPQTPLASKLKQNPNWQVVVETEREVLFVNQ